MDNIRYKNSRKLLDLEVDKKKKTIWFFANIIVISICKILLLSLIYKIVTLAIFRF